MLPELAHAPAKLEGNHMCLWGHSTCCPNWPVGIENECDAACPFEAETGSSEVWEAAAEFFS